MERAPLVIAHELVITGDMFVTDGRIDRAIETYREAAALFKVAGKELDKGSTADALQLLYKTYQKKAESLKSKMTSSHSTTISTVEAQVVRSVKSHSHKNPDIVVEEKDHDHDGHESDLKGEISIGEAEHGMRELEISLKSVVDGTGPPSRTSSPSRLAPSGSHSKPPISNTVTVGTPAIAVNARSSSSISSLGSLPPSRSFAPFASVMADSYLIVPPGGINPYHKASGVNNMSYGTSISPLSGSIADYRIKGDAGEPMHGEIRRLLNVVSTLTQENANLIASKEAQAKQLEHMEDMKNRLKQFEAEYMSRFRALKSAMLEYKRREERRSAAMLSETTLGVSAIVPKASSSTDKLMISESMSIKIVSHAKDLEKAVVALTTKLRNAELELKRKEKKLTEYAALKKWYDDLKSKSRKGGKGKDKEKIEVTVEPRKRGSSGADDTSEDGPPAPHRPISLTRESSGTSLHSSTSHVSVVNAIKQPSPRRSPLVAPEPEGRYHGMKPPPLELDTAAMTTPPLAQPAHRASTPPYAKHGSSPTSALHLHDPQSRPTLAYNAIRDRYTMNPHLADSVMLPSHTSDTPSHYPDKESGSGLGKLHSFTSPRTSPPTRLIYAGDDDAPGTAGYLADSIVVGGSRRGSSSTPATSPLVTNGPVFFGAGTTELSDDIVHDGEYAATDMYSEVSSVITSPFLSDSTLLGYSATSVGLDLSSLDEHATPSDNMLRMSTATSSRTFEGDGDEDLFAFAPPKKSTSLPATGSSKRKA